MNRLMADGDAGVVVLTVQRPWGCAKNGADPSLPSGRGVGDGIPLGLDYRSRFRGMSAAFGSGTDAFTFSLQG